MAPEEQYPKSSGLYTHTQTHRERREGQRERNRHGDRETERQTDNNHKRKQLLPIGRSQGL